ncbi:variable surface protein [Plasmodium gonderi]|uniref:Variable surface protein n=1 Tax=Plasmodium gonderi TaxID=77519 RepID=A0A1Y1JTD6_PLAGO|nr:variable surface protein [Plasmodium gonderi]GAW84032.1 variable surface protein [Plasmodium gonderi]
MMIETMFEPVKFFPKWEQIIDNIDWKTEKDFMNYCNYFKGKFPNTFNSNVEDICYQSLAYLDKVYTTYESSLEETAFIYFYYWIYKYKLKKGGNVEDIKKLYKELIEKFDESWYSHTRLKKYKEKYIPDNELEDLMNLHDMYKSFILIKNKCEPNKNENYCNTIKDIMNKYNPQVIIETNKTSTPKELHYCQVNIVKSIIITIVITLVISSLLVIIYKFIPYGSFMNFPIKRNRNKCNNTYDEWNSMQSSEISSNISRNRIYDVLYNST